MSQSNFVIATVFAIYRIEKPRSPEDRRKIGKILENLFFAYFWSNFPLFLAYFSTIFWIWGFFYSVDGQGFCNFMTIHEENPLPKPLFGTPRLVHFKCVKTHALPSVGVAPLSTLIWLMLAPPLNT